MRNDEFSETGQYLGTMPTQAEATATESEMILCHCGRQFHARLCSGICPFCKCPRYRGEDQCWALKQRAYELELSNKVHGPLAQNDMTTIDRLVSAGTIVKGCKGCEVFFTNPGVMAPSHKASDRCRSGKRDHCTCDTCF
jgi:hypothetical protein